MTARSVQARWSDEAPLTPAVDFDLTEGRRLALVGASGSGKSTLAAVLLRLLDPSAGSVEVAGRNVTSWSGDAVRGRVGLVDDQPHLFATTLVENVRLARPEASDADVAAALDRACLGAWVNALPQGLHTFVGDGHAAVSGGERARIAVARSLLADQAVLVLDEPTAHLDSATASALAEEVLRPGEYGGDVTRSVLWITHTDAGLDLVDAVVRLGEPLSPPALLPQSPPACPSAS